MTLGLVGAAGLAAAAIAAPSAQPGVWRFHDEHVLGTRLNLVAVAADETAALAAAHAARREIDRLDGVFNSRREGSELHRLNAAGEIQASTDLFAVLSRAEHWRGLTGGAYSPGLGRVLDLWRASQDVPPDRAELRRLVKAASRPTTLGPGGAVRKAPGVALALDGLAKGYIVDRALLAARAAAPGLAGLLVDIGGDMGCWGRGPDGGRWDVGVTDPARPADIAPCVAIARLTGQAIATSGLGPRDRLIGGRRFSPTLSPGTGWPVDANLAATVIADCAADADALATAFLVMPPERALRLADGTPGVAARIQAVDGGVHTSRNWSTFASEPPPRLIRIQGRPLVPTDQRWPRDWALELIYTAPRKQDVRSADFRTPYMVMWITDEDGEPVRTLTMVGRDARWQRDNFIWWANYRSNAPQIVGQRSEGTSLSGRYSLYWRGVDDVWDAVPLGRYTLHIETSQERGKHSHRTVPLNIGREGFSASLPFMEDSGGLQISYGLKR